MSGALLLATRVSVGYNLPSTVSDVSTGVAAVATLNMNSNGTFSCIGNTLGTTQSGNWVTPTVLAPGTYTIRLHVDSGTSPAGSALDSDLALSSSRSWNLTEAILGTLSSTCTITLKDGGGTTLVTGTVTFTANRAA